MSRAIKNATIKPSFEAFHNGNKLIFTKVKGRMGAYLVKNDRLVAVNLMIKEQENMGAIYIGKVKNVVKNLNACFVEIAEKEICYLPMKEAENPFLINREFDGRILEGPILLWTMTILCFP